MIDYPAVQRALHSAAPEALPETLRAVLLTMGVSDAQVHLVDYGLRVLIPVAGPPDSVPLPVRDSVEGRVFAGQQPLVHRPDDGTTVVTVPMTVRGDRHGTLTARLPSDDAGSAEVEALEAVARLLGHEIVVADRDTDRYQRARRAARLTLAAETQWELLPGRSSRRREYALGAQLEPAYAIRGDGYDWAADDTSLILTVVNGMGEGITAALLTSLAVNALRNARRAGLSLADQAALADQAVFAQHRGDLYVAALLMSFAYDTGEVTVVDAGSPQIWRRRGRSIEQITVEPQLPLGMFEETAYKPQSFQVQRGDRLVIVSDGVHTASSPLGEAYVEKALHRGINDSALLPPAEVPIAILREVSEHRSADADDDAVVVCLDWFGDEARD
ncbi:serine phosphatase RsbU (regulator of sigma subunit) [Catenulispora sp. MAP5-51]|uniref:PP2C family protein-serine/threonine phosphatase n=1 Tax=Catenulispora sp. MAP5-51 TaxID=3156298 RepID=UPI003513001F